MGIVSGYADGVAKYYRRKENSLLFLCGGILVALAITMVPSLLIAALKGDSLAIMGVPILIGLMLGAPLVMRYRLATVIRPPDALAMMAVLWITCFVFGMLPFVMCGMSVVDALFESASGFTTTGVDVFPDYTVFPDCILFWRSTSAWLGGIMIILIFMFLMPMVGGGTRTALGNETSGSSGGAYNRTMRLRDAALQFILVYVLLTSVMALILVLMGYSLFEAITLAFCTLSTGGFMASSVVFTPALKIVILIFMFLGATNFYLHYRAVFQRDIHYGKSEEFMGVLVWCIVMSFVLFFLLNPDPLNNVFDNYLDSLFMTVSASSTTGYSYEDFGSWHYASMIVLYLLAIVGASSGSTAGGIKISRVIIALKALRRSFEQVIRPNAVNPIRMDGNNVPDDVVKNVLIVIMLFGMTIIGFSLLFMVFGYSGTGSISCSIALISNFGTAVGEFAAGYGVAPNIIKLIMIVMMWFGRLEILVAMAILSPRVWKDQYLNFKKNRRDD
jgi:trk system potassium uptake protein TrkH